MFALCALIGNSLQILAPKPILASPSSYSQQIVEIDDPPIACEDGWLVNHQIEAFQSNSSSPAGLIPTTIQTVYSLPSIGGSGTIAIIDAYDDPTIFEDTNTFCAAFDLPPLTSTNFRIVKYVPRGLTIGSNVNWTAEISLDVQWAHALAPSANILLVEAYNESWLLNAVNLTRFQSDVVSISMSWGGNEFSTESNYDWLFTGSYNATFLAASGDRGENVSWPASSPNVVGVGGTKLNFNSNGSLASEVVWNDGNGYTTGGGISAYEAEPSYQLSYGVTGSNGHRSVPDVSFDAGTGVSVYSSSPTEGGTGWLSFGGTSLGTPCWAAINSLNHTVSNPRLYAFGKSAYNSSCFRDITSGNNVNYSATNGYDFCTGLGSPITSSFVSLLPGDVNLEGHVNVYDAIALATAFATVNGDSLFNPYADINNDNKVDIFDAILLAIHFGKSYTSGSGRGALGNPPSGGALTQGGASIIVDPTQTVAFKDEVFTVNVEVTGVTDLLGWEFKLYWNSSVLNCTNAAVQSPSQWENYTQDYGTGLENSYNATNGRFFKAETAAYPAPSFNGSMTIAALTFQAMQPGTTSLTLVETELGNSTAQPIDHIDSSGSVNIYYGRYMRSDTQQVNGLSAYKLNIPQSTSSAVNTQSGSGMGALFGIRAWVRHSNGIEQEISLDGQTGTPKATVGGGSAGIRSNTVSIAQTALQSTDSLVVRVYVQIAEGPWNLCATFTTEQLHASTLKATTWTVYYYTSSTYNRITDRTTAKFYWGTTTYNSRIQNLQFN
jgi:hypothetical protein